jgi:thiol:disulfide interchange protein DsbC
MLILKMRKFSIILFSVITAALLSIVPAVYSKDKDVSEVVKCDTITKEEALNILKDSFPDIKVLETRLAPVKGFWEVVMESKGQKGIGYIDCSKKYLMSGSLLDLKTKANLTQERFIEISKVDVSKIPLDDALVMGDKKAKHHIIVFDDPE